MTDAEVSPSSQTLSESVSLLSEPTINDNSDSELTANDTLRFDDSDENAEQTIVETSKNHVVAVKRKTKMSRIIDNESDEEEEPEKLQDDLENENPNKTSKFLDSDTENEAVAKKTSKISKLIDSDSEDEMVAQTTKKSVLSDSESDHSTSNGLTDGKSAETGKPNVPSKKYSNLVDSDSKTDDGDGKPNEVSKGKRKRFIKKKSDKKEKKKSAHDILAHLNLDLGGDSSSSKDSGSSSENSNNSEEEEADTSIAEEGRNKPEKAQRMSAKHAIEQMKVIQSESQRMAREASVNTPYHRPKQHSLKEFLNRRTVMRTTLSPIGGHIQKAAAAIKMSAADLEIYAKQLEERAKEAKEFFKSESEEEKEEEIMEKKQLDVISNEVIENLNEASALNEATPEITTPVDDSLSAGSSKVIAFSEPCDTLTVLETEPFTEVDQEMETIINKSFVADEIIATQLQTENETPLVAEPVEVDYNLFDESEKEKLKAAKKIEILSNVSISCPSLSGDPNMVMDFDSGEFVPKEPSGVDILFQRFAKCSSKRKKKASNFTILQTENGIVKMETLTLDLNEDTDPNKKEPIPGAALMKLQETLRNKIAFKRKEELLKKIEESQKQKELENAEYSDGEYDEEFDDEEGEESDKDGKEQNEENENDAENIESEKQIEIASVTENMIDDEAEVADEVDEVDEEESDKESSETSDNDEETDAEIEKTINKKSRIKEAFVDSDEEVTNKIPDTLPRNTTDEMFQTQETELSFTNKNISSHSEVQNTDNISLLWQDSEDKANEDEDDLLGLCSGRFDPTQATQTQSVANEEARKEAAVLFTQETPVLDDTELMALCSGQFATQVAEKEKNNPALDTEPHSPIMGRLALESSDEEMDNGTETSSKKIKKKKKRKNLEFSDDEDGEQQLQVDDEDEESELEEEPEKFVDYDSEENEIEVRMTKTDCQKAAGMFFENEAERSEDDVGSADEDEEDMDRYDIELGDEDNYDQHKLQEELERIHMKRVLEQDKKDVQRIQHMLFEDEEKDGVGRERQFRWKNVDQSFSLDYEKKDENTENINEGSDEENEETWRKMRHERETLLKEKQGIVDDGNLSVSILDKTEEETSTIRKKITIISTNKKTDSVSQNDSPFLISKALAGQACRASFLTRDEATLNKLACMTKVNPDMEGASTAVAAKGRNFVFSAISPAVKDDKTNSKRSLEEDANDAPKPTNKKIKVTEGKENQKTKKRLFELLM